MKIQGLDLKKSSNDLDDSLSPDTSNAFFYGGKYALLGSRQGKTSFNTSAYTARVMGIIKARFGDQRKWILGETDGGYYPISAPLATNPTFSAPGTLHLMDFGGGVSVSVAYPSTTATWYSAFTTQIAVPLPNENFICDMPTLSLIATNGGDNWYGTCSLEIGIYKNSTGYWPSSAQITMTWDASQPANTSFTPSGTTYITSDAGYVNGLSGLIDGLALRLILATNSTILPGTATFAVSGINHAGTF